MSIRGGSLPEMDYDIKLDKKELVEVSEEELVELGRLQNQVRGLEKKLHKQIHDKTYLTYKPKARLVFKNLVHSLSLIRDTWIEQVAYDNFRRQESKRESSSFESLQNDVKSLAGGS